MTEKRVKTDEHDQIMGQALNRATTGVTIGNTCPSMEEIAELVDDTIDPDRRDALLGHVAGCERCYQIFNATRESVNNEEQSIGKNRHYLSIAAAVVVVITAASFFFWQPKLVDHKLIVSNNTPAIKNSVPSMVPPSVATSPMAPDSGQINKSAFILPTQVAAALARHVAPKQLASQIALRKDTTYGFSGTIPVEKTMFRMGVLAVDVEVLLKGTDRENTLQHLRALRELFHRRTAFRQSAVVLTDMIEQLEKGAPSGRFSGYMSSLTARITDDKEKVYFSFGVWSEGGRLASLTANGKYLTLGDIHYFKANLKGDDLPQGIFAALSDIEKAARETSVTQTELNIQEEAFTDIIGML